ncbi:MAG: hypothetical protein NZ108_06705 [Bacteroidia bacterium]|nr:hypothetical protein [Bacteroidia bacterium]
MNRFGIICLLAFISLLLACSKTDLKKDFENQQLAALYRGTIKVKVFHPQAGNLKGLVVHLYQTFDDFDNRVPYASARTDSLSITYFSRVPAGKFMVDCYIPGDTNITRTPAYYAADTAYVPVQDTGLVNLYLQAQ